MKKNLFILAIFILLVLSLLLYGAFVKKPSVGIGNLEQKNLIIGEKIISVEIPKTKSELERGLGGRISLEPNSGMLFDFGTLSGYGIWMKDMLFPIDVIWLDQNFMIVDVTLHMEPDSYPKVFTAKSPARYALEVETGFVEKNDLKIGDKVKFE